MKYKWKRQPIAGLSVDEVAEYLQQLEEEAGGLTPEYVVWAAKKKKSPIHDCFEWDDTAAATLYRLEQARCLLRQIEVIVEQDDAEDIEIRAFHCVETEEKGVFYTTLKKARENDELWEQVKRDALSELKKWQQKYRHIKEFEVVFQAIEQLA